MKATPTFRVALLLSIFSLTGCAGEPRKAPPKQTDSPATRAAANAESFRATFDDSAEVPTGWDRAGEVSIDSQNAFEGTRSLQLRRADVADLKPVQAISPAFKVEQGNYQVIVSMKSDLASPDNSFKGELTIDYTDQNGRPGQIVTIGELDKKQNWKQIKKDISIPATIVSARFRARIDKAAGNFWIDSLSIKPSTVSSGDPVVNRIFFDTVQMGNLLFPTDKRTVKVTAWTLRELTDAERNLSALITDYWGAEQGKAIPVTVQKTGMARNTYFVYEGSFNFESLPLENGRYYEIRATLNKESNGKPAGTFSNYTSFAILPYAPANRYKPEEIPFTSRTWDARIDVAQYLNHRLGIRIGGIWGGWQQEAPHAPYAATIEVLEKQGMGFLTGSPAHDVEQRNAKADKWNDENLRAGVRNFIAKYGHIKPMIINLGNEPPNKGDEVKRNVEAYKSIYEEVKKIDPSIIVVGTSVGPSEDFFKAGFGKYLDAYDFHIYGDSFEVRDTIEKQYPALWAKYGDKKPIWSTELGFSSHGMARIQVVREMAKKFANFFAAGGANMSWFGIMYPDPDAQIVGTGGESHNVFDCRYEKYAPKLDGISYYNLVNAIAAKKFVSEKVYDNGVKAFLFRDKENLSLQILYMEKGRADIGVPLKDVDSVQVIRVDGTRSTLTPSNGKITLTAGEDPLLLLYAGGDVKLPDALVEPAGQIDSSDSAIVSGEIGNMSVTLKSVKAEVKVPFNWHVELTHSNPNNILYGLVVPKGTTAREGDVIVRLSDSSGRTIGELYHRPAVSGAITMNVLPVPAASSKSAGIKLVINNRGKDPQSVSWSAALTGCKPVTDGEYPEKPTSTDAYFTAESSGELNLAGGASQEIFLPMAKIDLHTTYFVKAVARDSSGREVIDERPIAGFVSVPKVAKGSIKIDGDLSDPAWQKAFVQRIDKLEQFFNFRRPNRDKEWTGPADLSADIRYLWDDSFLYVAVDVKDDIAGKPQTDGMIWAQDGLQFLFDPTRTSTQKSGRYDYAVALSQKGPQAWGYLTADSALAPSGEVKDFQLGLRRTDPKTGNTIYELAIPWSRLSPFKPAIGADLGCTLIVNEDDDKGRDSFLTWFGNAHAKDVETVGDLILAPESQP